MRLNHINLIVSDVAKAVELFENHFGFRCTEMKGEHVIAILKGADDFTLVVMIAKEAVTYPSAFHIGFMQQSQEAVTEIHTNLKLAGYDVGAEPKKIRDSFGFYFTFDAVMIEVGYYLP